MKVCTAHDPHSSEGHRPEALLGIFFLSSFSAFLSEALLGLFCKHFFRISLSLWLKLETAEIRRNAEDWKHWKKNPQMRKNPQNPHPWVKVLPHRLSGMVSQKFCDVIK